MMPVNRIYVVSDWAEQLICLDITFLNLNYILLALIVYLFFRVEQNKLINFILFYSEHYNKSLLNETKTPSSFWMNKCHLYIVYCWNINFNEATMFKI